MTQNRGVTEAKRGRPRKHPSWTDSAGISRALRDHPNYSVCRNFQRNALAPVHPDDPYASRHGDAEHFQLVQRWKEDIAAFTYELTKEIGIRENGFQLIWPTDPRLPVGPGNVQWLHRPRNLREARLRQIAGLEAQELLDAADLRPQSDGSYIFGSVVDSLEHYPSCESQWIDPIECPCTYAIRERLSEF